MPRSADKGRSLVVYTHPKSHISESYRTLRTNISFSSIDKDVKVIAVTSAGPGEGKSTTVSNLAVTYAQADKRVLVIDGDMRKPTVHHTFLQSNRRGLSNVLAGQCRLEDVMVKTEIFLLSVITAGPIPPNPSEMLSSNRMTALLEQLRADFDMILIDTPPALAVTDTQVLAAKADGVLLVVDSGKAKREAVQKAKISLDYVQANVLGVVINNVERKKSDNYYYYYGSN